MSEQKNNSPETGAKLVGDVINAAIGSDGSDPENGKKRFCCRFKSPALWVSLASLVIFCVKEFAGADISAEVNAVMNHLLPVLCALGILNNPTDLKHI